MAVLNGSIIGGTSGITRFIHNVSGTSVTNIVNNIYASKCSPNVTGGYFNLFWNQYNSVAGALTEYVNLTDLVPPGGAGDSFIGMGNNVNSTVAIYYDVSARYDRVSNTSVGFLARYTAGATVVLTLNSSGTWALPLADTKVDGYVSDSSNFPSSKSALILNGGVPAFRFIGRSSAPADAVMFWQITGFIAISD